MQVADDDIGVDDVFALEIEHHPQHAVRGRMLRAHVERHVAAALGRLDDALDLDARAYLLLSLLDVGGHQTLSNPGGNSTW